MFVGSQLTLIQAVRRELESWDSEEKRSEAQSKLDAAVKALHDSSMERWKSELDTILVFVSSCTIPGEAASRSCVELSVHRQVYSPPFSQHSTWSRTGCCSPTMQTLPCPQSGNYLPTCATSR